MLSRPRNQPIHPSRTTCPPASEDQDWRSFNGTLSRDRQPFPGPPLLPLRPPFGKTTLLAEWAAHSASRIGAAPARLPSRDEWEALPLRPIQGRFAWLSLDEGDNDPARFLAYLIAALRTVEPGLGAGALSALQSPQPPPFDAVLTALINDIAASQRDFVLVLDGYRLLDALLLAAYDITSWTLAGLVVAWRLQPEPDRPKS
jgi:hypothetical protein